MGNENNILFTVISSLIAAVGWLAKKLYDSPRNSEIEALRKERDELRKIVDDAADESRLLAKDRDTENRKLRDEITELRFKVERRASSGGGHVIVRQQRRQ